MVHGSVIRDDIVNGRKCGWASTEGLLIVEAHDSYHPLCTSEGGQCADRPREDVSLRFGRYVMLE
jgi:hypothetical protein